MTKSDREWAYLSEQTGMKAPFNDMYFRYLRGLGYTGTLQDMIAASGLGFSPSKYVPPYDPSALSLFDRFDNDPTPERKTLINDLIVALKDEGIWSKLDTLWLMAAADAQGARLNWVADQYNLTPVAAPVFTVDQGYTGDGISSYLETGFNPATAGGKFTQNSAALGGYSRTAAQGNGYAFGNINGTMSIRNSSDQNIARLTGNGGITTASVTDGSGLFVVSRVNSAGISAYRNKVVLFSETASASTAPSSEAIRFLGRAGSVSFSNRQLSFGFIASGLSAAEISAMYDAVAAYLIDLGALV